MKTVLSPVSLSLLILALLGTAPAMGDQKDKKSPLPGNATWELKPMQSLFRVVATEHDAAARKIKWSVETRDGYRTADFVREITRRPFVFRFLDGANKELAIIQLTKDDFHGLPRERIMKPRTRLTIMLNVPAAMPRTKKVVLQRGPID